MAGQIGRIELAIAGEPGGAKQDELALVAAKAQRLDRWGHEKTAFQYC